MFKGEIPYIFTSSLTSACVFNDLLSPHVITKTSCFLVSFLTIFYAYISAPPLLNGAYKFDIMQIFIFYFSITLFPSKLKFPFIPKIFNTVGAISTRSISFLLILKLSVWDKINTAVSCIWFPEYSLWERDLP